MQVQLLAFYNGLFFIDTIYLPDFRSYILWPYKCKELCNFSASTESSFWYILIHNADAVPNFGSLASWSQKYKVLLSFSASANISYISKGAFSFSYPHTAILLEHVECSKCMLNLYRKDQWCFMLIQISIFYCWLSHLWCLYKWNKGKWMFVFCLSSVCNLNTILCVGVMLCNAT